MFNGFDLNSVSNVLGSLDTLDGGAGTDQLQAYLPVASTLTPNLTGIEIVTLTADGTTTVNLAQSTGVTSVTNMNSGAALTVNNINDTSVALKVQDQANIATTFAFKPTAVAGTADTASLTLENVTDGASITIGSIETLNVASQGSANSVTIKAAAAGTLKITGDQALRLDVVEAVLSTSNAAVTKVDASAMSGALTVSTGALGTSTVAVSIAGGSGADIINAAAVTGRVSISGGAGNDRISHGNYLAGIDAATADSIDGGDGTDILVATYLKAKDYVTPATRTISGIETLEISDTYGTTAVSTRAIDTGISKVVLAAAGATTGAVNVNFNSGESTLEIGRSTAVTGGDAAAATTSAALAGTLTVSSYGSGTGDAVTVSNKNAVGSATDAFAEQAITAGTSSAGVETLTINSGTYTTAATQTLGNLTFVASTGTSATTVKFLGSNPVAMGTTGSNKTIGANVIDASGMSSGGKLTMAAAGTSTTITGSAGRDTLIGAATTASTIDGGTGNDTITGGGAADSLIGGAGDDSIVSGGGNDTIVAGDGNDTINATAADIKASLDGGAGNDVINVGGNLATGQKIIGGDGTDKLQVTTTSIGTFMAESVSNINTFNANLSGIEAVEVTNALANDFDVGRIGGISNVILSAGNAAKTISGLAATNEINLNAAALGAKLTLALADATGTNDTIGLKLTSAGTLNFQTADNNYAVEIASVENLTVYNEDSALTTNPNGAASTIANTVLVAPATGDTKLKTITISGNATTSAATALTLNLGSATTAVKTVDASAAKFGTTISIANSLVDATMTGGSKADALTGGAGADSLSGGAGNDTLTGGAGDDTYVGGAGDDTLTLGASSGSETIVFESSGTANGSDVIGNFKVGLISVGGDVLKLSGFLSSGSVADASGTAGIQAYAAGSTGAVNITNKVAILSAADVASLDTAAEVTAQIGSTKAFTVDASGKAVILAVGSGTTAYLWGIENDATSTVSAGEVYLLGTITLTDNYADGAFLTANFSL